LSNEIFFVFGSITTIILGLFLVNYFNFNKNINSDLSRKVLHLATGIIASTALYVVNNYLLISIVTLIIILLLITIKFYGGYKQIKYLTITRGMIYFAISYFILVVSLGKLYREIIVVSMLIMSISDSAAAVIGSFISVGNYNLSGNNKTVLGTVSFFVSTFIILIMAPVYTQVFYNLTYHFFYNLIIALILALQLSLIEGLSSKGTDNLFVPIYSAVFLFLVINPINTINIEQYLLGVFLSFLMVYFSLRLKFLNKSGSIATFLLANSVFGLGSFKWTIPIVTFFVLSSLLSKLRSNNKKSAERYYEKTGVRDYKQVFANGGIAGILVILNSIHPNEIYYLLYVAFIATVCSDTWSTELGTLFNSVTYSIIGFKETQQGTSGGVSVIGTIGGVFGSVIIAIVSFSFTTYNIFYFFLIILISSFLGNISDSILGATVQQSFKCTVCEKNTERAEHCGRPAILTKGFSFINNDIVNVVAGTFSIAICIIIYYLIFI
jgi:uncharacterized protein (TIGR00297 family)